MGFNHIRILQLRLAACSLRANSLALIVGNAEKHTVWQEKRFMGSFLPMGDRDVHIDVSIVLPLWVEGHINNNTTKEWPQ